MRNVEVVTVVIAGRRYERWERMTVAAAIDEAVRSFQIETTERPGEFFAPPGTPVEIFANGDLLVAGYVNAYEASAEAKSHRILIRGRSKGQDFVDSSAEHEEGFFEDKTAEEIGQALNKWDIGIRAEVPLDPIPYAQLKPGETAFQMLERYLRPEGVSMMGTAAGDILLTNAEVARAHYGILMEGHTIKSFDVSLTDGSRHSRYIVKGQSRKGGRGARFRIRAEAADRGVKRRRTRILANETDTDDRRARKRAQHEKERAAGRSVMANVTTQGFRDFAGALFEPNRLIYVHAPVLMHLVQTMLIQRVEWTQDSKAGSEARLQLVDPRAFKGRGGKGDAPGAPESDEVSDPAWTEGY